jgi:subtilase family serine protease
MRRGVVGGFLVCVIAAACLAIVEGKQPSADRAATYVVQLAGPVLERWKSAITDAGGDIQDYVPPFAFHVRMTPPAAARVRRLGFVTAVTAVRPDRKLAAGLQRGGRRPYLVRIDRAAVPTAIEAALRDAGVQLLRRGRQFLIVAEAADLDRLAAIDGLATIENYAPRIKHNEYGGGVILGSHAVNALGFDGSSQTIAIADTGLGFGTAAAAHADIQPSRVNAIFNWPGTPDFCFETIVNDGAQDVDTGHGTHVATTALGAGTASGVGRGTAPAANLVFQAIENYAVPSLLCSLIYGLPEGYYLVGIPDDVGVLFNQGYQQGARVHSNSWGAEVAGAYSADSANADAFVWSHRDLTVTFSAGNSGTDSDGDGLVDEMSINAPGTAKNVLTVGASENDRQSHWECDSSLTYTPCAASGGQNQIFTYGSAWPERFPANPLRDDVSAGNAEQMAAFSSRGPTNDGRIKPDVVAPGTWMLSGYSDAYQQQYDGSPNPVNGAYQYDGWGDPASASHKYLGGTSMAAPLVAGGAAVVRDFYLKARAHQVSAALVKAVLINSAVDLLDENNDGVFDNANPIPNMHEGWGRVDLVNATDASDAYFDEIASLSTGATAAHAFEVTSPGVPLKVTLAWTDYPASTSAATSLVNDLDLTVVAPDGTTYTGNAFSGGWSVPGGPADRLNNVENVYVFSAAAGTWTINVNGYNIPNGPQPFALVVDAGAQGTGLPMVRVTVDDATATESGPTGGVLRFTRSGDTASALEVAYSVAGTATAGSDFAALSGSITIPEGSVDATLLVSALDDLLYEPAESVIVTVLPTPAYTVSSPSAGAISIASDDLPPDLMLTAISAPTLVAAGSTITVNATTKNQGAGPAPESVTAFYLSTNSTWDAADVYLGERAVSGLAPAANEASATLLELPATTAAGTYIVLGKADAANVVAESQESNNVRASSSMKVGPDLLIAALSVPQTASAGETLLVTETTKNQGAASAGATMTAFFLSTNTAFDASDVPLGTRTVPALAGSATSAAPTTLLIPPTTAVGVYYVLAQADSAGAVAEYLETNNVKSSGTVKVGADLSVTALTAPMFVDAGQVIDVNETTANLGATDAPESTTRYHFSLNATYEASDTLLASRQVPALDSGAVSAATVQVTIPGNAATGVYYLIASADADHAIAETTESNNRKTFKISVGADLQVADIDGPASAEAGGSLTAIDATKNAGGGPAAASETSFYLSANTSLDAADVWLGVRSVPQLAAGQTNIGTTTFTVPAETASGVYYLIAKADHGAVVPELIETNNTRASALIRIGPDLNVSAVTAPNQVTRGVSFSVTDTTRNVGSAAPATTTSYYLSTNSALDAGDLLLATRPVAALAAGASQTGQASVVIPATQATGTYYIIAKADHANVAAESHEANNTLSKTIRVNP